jgi:hypothetical protein
MSHIVQEEEEEEEEKGEEEEKFPSRPDGLDGSSDEAARRPKNFREMLTALKESKNPPAFLFRICQEKWPDWKPEKPSHEIGHLGKMCVSFGPELVLRAIWITETEEIKPRDSPLGFVHQNAIRLRAHRKTYRGEATHTYEDFKHSKLGWGQDGEAE